MIYRLLVCLPCNHCSHEFQKFHRNFHCLEKQDLRHGRAFGMTEAGLHLPRTTKGAIMLSVTLPISKPNFYREFIVARSSFEPRDFGVNMDKPEFLDQMVDEFGIYTKGQLSLDEMLLRPRTALHFCDEVRKKYGYFDLPDDIILRSVMQRQKNPSGEKT